MADRHPFHQWVNLAQPRLGTQVVYATDDFFADKSRLIDPADPVFIEGKYDDNGKWMDGWESRRKRTPGHDHCIVRLGCAGIVHGVDINTSHFTGNFPPAASISACYSEAEIPAENEWQEFLPKVDLQGNNHHYLEITSKEQITHLKLDIFPDGGIARLRVYGEISPRWDTDAVYDEMDLLALGNGGRALLCNDEHFGSMHNLNVPGRGINMGDGWETARRRMPGNDWVILKLGCPGEIVTAQIDTAHFKGNYPDRVSLRGAFVETGSNTNLESDSQTWRLLLEESKLSMDNVHNFDQLPAIGPISHIRMDIFPDGGVSRLRLLGKPQPMLADQT